jgi:hypothetical protein
MRSIPLVLALVVAGCTTMTIEEAKQTWVGATYDEAVRTWGPPQRSGKLSDGADVHTWVSESGPAYRSGPTFGFGVGGVSGGGRGGVGVGVGGSVPIGQGTVEPPARCERTFTFRDGRMAEQNWIGQDSVCTEYARPKPQQK